MIYKHSRYINTPAVKEGDRFTFKIRTLENISLVNSISHTLVEGETVYSLAYRYFGDYSMWWVILQVNNKKLPEDIHYGDVLIIPSYEEVMKIYG